VQLTWHTKILNKTCVFLDQFQRMRTPAFPTKNHFLVNQWTQIVGSYQSKKLDISILHSGAALHFQFFCISSTINMRENFRLRFAVQWGSIHSLGSAVQIRRLSSIVSSYYFHSFFESIIFLLHWFSASSYVSTFSSSVIILLNNFEMSNLILIILSECIWCMISVSPICQFIVFVVVLLFDK